MSLYTELKQLCLCPSISGRESGVREIIKTQIETFVDSVSVDTLGNLIALKKGAVGGEKIMLCAHMDEIGYLVNFIEDSGMIRVTNIGGISWSDSVFGKVVSGSGVAGVLVPEATVKAADIKADNVYVDIGAKSKKEAERLVKIGDFFVAEPSLTKLCGKRVAGRPLDDRVGCLILLEIAKKLKDTKTNADVYFVFSVQEEVGCRGSRTATYGIQPTDSLCFDVTRTGDALGAKPMACALGKGAAIKIKDASVICHGELVDELCSLAKAEKIPYQLEILTGGGTDTSSMQMTAGGSRAGALSVPTRYIHSAVETCDMGDVEACIELAYRYILSRG